ATASVPITNRQSLKFSYSDGAIARFGGNYRNVSAAWQYSWIGRRAANTLPGLRTLRQLKLKDRPTSNKRKPRYDSSCRTVEHNEDRAAMKIRTAIFCCVSFFARASSRAGEHGRDCECDVDLLFGRR